MVNDAAAHADEDKKQREKIDTRNQAESMVYQAEKQLADNADKVPADMKARIESALAKVKDAIKTDDTEQIKSAMAAAEKDMHEFAQELYKNANPNAGAQGGAGFNPQDFAEQMRNAQNQQPGGDAAGNGGNDGNGPVYDADFKEKN